ncbi:golgin subfamily A member 6-like protein 7 [Palaemon carinicauda]|uniref:golgin subfamily A member 6-like protein 7 n=1 Tax=Palaemon carinicauda TaxID=392227 RepID=UPI0035B59F65
MYHLRQFVRDFTKDLPISVILKVGGLQNFIGKGFPVGAMATGNFFTLATVGAISGGVAVASLGFLTLKEFLASKKRSLIELEMDNTLAEVEGLEKKIEDLKLIVEEKMRKEMALRAIREDETQKIKIRIDNLLDQEQKQKDELEDLQGKLDISRNREKDRQDLLNEGEEDFEETMNAKDRDNKKILEKLELENLVKKDFNEMNGENMLKQINELNKIEKTLENDKEKQNYIENLKNDQDEQKCNSGELVKYKEEISKQDEQKYCLIKTIKNNDINERTPEKVGKESAEKTPEDELGTSEDSSREYSLLLEKLREDRFLKEERELFNNLVRDIDEKIKRKLETKDVDNYSEELSPMLSELSEERRVFGSDTEAFGNRIRDIEDSHDEMGSEEDKRELKLETSEDIENFSEELSRMFSELSEER